MLKKIIAIAFFSLLMISCSSVKTRKGTISQTYKIRSFPLWNSNFENLKIKANLSVSYNNQSYSASANIRIAKSDSISVKINGPFGISIGKLYANPNEFEFYNAITDQLIEGEPNAGSFQQIIKMPLSYNDLIRLMRCETPGDPKDFVFVNKINQSESLFKNDKNHDYIEYAIISPDSTLKQYQRKLRNGQMIFHVFFENYETINGIRYASKHIYKFSKINSKLSITIKNIEINSFFQKAFKTVYPSGIEKIKLN